MIDPNRPVTDPVELYRLRDGSYAADLLIVAVAELDLFTWLRDNAPATTADLRAALALDSRPLDVLITYLAALGLVARGPGDAVRLTPVAEDHLVAGSPYDLRAYHGSLRERPGCAELLAVLRTGTPAAWASAADQPNWSSRLAEPGFAASITAAMDARGRYLGPALAQALDRLPDIGRALDVGGGSGIYASALVDRRPEVRAAVLERAPVDAAARQLLAERGHADRVDVVTADMFTDPLPTGYDLHLYSHVLHDWDEPRVRALFAASYAALPPGGWLVDHDTHVNADRTGPLPVAEYSVLLMHSTPGKCWSVTELADLLTETGFEFAGHHPTTADRGIVLARKPRSE